MSEAEAIDTWQPEIKTKHKIPIFISAVNAGQPLSADSAIDQHIDLNEFLIKNPTATFFVRVEGRSMVNAGIHPGDILIVDKSIDPLPNNIVIAVVDGDFLVKRLITECGERFLVGDSPDYGRIELRKGSQVELWGVVTWVVHKVGQGNKQ